MQREGGAWVVDDLVVDALLALYHSIHNVKDLSVTSFDANQRHFVRNTTIPSSAC
jgi:hypothetical protein